MGNKITCTSRTKIFAAEVFCVTVLEDLASLLKEELVYSLMAYYHRAVFSESSFTCNIYQILSFTYIGYTSFPPRDNWK